MKVKGILYCWSRNTVFLSIELEALVRQSLAGEALPAARKEAAQANLPSSYDMLLSRMGKFFSNGISVRRSPSGKGSMTIRFDSDEEVEHFLAALDAANI